MPCYLVWSMEPPGKKSVPGDMSTMTLLQSDMKRTRNQQTIFYLYPIYRNSTFSFLFLFQLFLFLWRALKPSNMCKSGKSWLCYIIIIIIILFIVTSALYSTSNKSFEADMVDIISLEEKRVNSAYGHTLKQISIGWIYSFFL